MKSIWIILCVIGMCVSTTYARDRIRIDGSSTVAPITMAAAEMFMAEHPNIAVTVGVSGTGGGFKKFLSDYENLRTDINDASRPIKKAERDRAEKLNIEYVEIPIGLDGIAVVVNPKNTWCDNLTTTELKKLWEPGSEIQLWSHIREEWPAIEINLYGPGPDSGTFDYFTEAIVGQSKASRSDYTASESDNVLVMGVRGDKSGLGYFGFSYYEANKDELKIIGITHDDQTVVPTLDTIRDGSYTPLSRPMFLYINAKLYEKKSVQTFMDYLLTNAETILQHPSVNYVPLSAEMYELSKGRLRDKITGSAMQNATTEQDLIDIFQYISK